MKYKDENRDEEKIITRISARHPTLSINGGLVPALFSETPTVRHRPLNSGSGTGNVQKISSSGGGFMAGKIRQMIDAIINQRAKDNPMLERVIKTKLILKGINPNRYTLQSDDDPTVIGKLEKMMQDLR
jgi:hypothetical protein